MDRRGALLGVGALAAVLPACTGSAGPAGPAGSSTIDLTSLGVFNVKDSGAVGDGAADDTGAIQAAIAAAQMVGGIVFFPPGSYMITAQLDVTSRITMLGVGYQGDDGVFYSATAGTRVTQATGWNASVIVCGASNHAISIATNDAVTIDGLQIVYPAVPATGITAIVGDCAAGSTTAANSYSVVRNVVISGPDVGIAIANWFDFLVENVKIYQASTTSISIAPTNYPSFGDGTITSCSLISLLCAQHILVQSGGGLRIVNNMLNGARSGGTAIVVAPFAGDTVALEPLIIANNSIEAQLIAIALLQQNTTAYIDQIVISGNQINLGNGFTNGPTSGIQVAGAAGWCTHMVVTGNVMLLDVGGFGVNLTGATDVLVANNCFQCSSMTEQTANAMYIGPNTSGITVHGNSYFQVPIATITPEVATSTPNTNPFPVQVIVYNGTGTSILVTPAGQPAALLVMSQAAGAFAWLGVLNPGDQIELVYSSAPSWIWNAISP